MHVVYKSADEPSLTETARNTMLDPALLRENVDGEAVRWASARLSGRPERHKILIVISDGAPVDDATLMHNGPSYLYRHLAKVIADIAEAGGLVLAGVGLEHRVEAFYPDSVSIETQADLPTAAVAVLERAFANVGD
jgi:cobaltochelatase CobT